MKKNRTAATSRTLHGSAPCAPAATAAGGEVRIPVDDISLEGDFYVPEHAEGLVLFAHGAGSSRLSPRNQYVAQHLHAKGVGTLLFDLLTPGEDQTDEPSQCLRFDIGLLTHRLMVATQWARSHPALHNLRVGYFGSSTGAAAALNAAAQLHYQIHAVVSRGGRPDLAGEALRRVIAPTLLLVGGRDRMVLELNREAYGRLAGEKELTVVPDATHLFEEPGALEAVSLLAADWFQRHLACHPVPGDAADLLEPKKHPAT